MCGLLTAFVYHTLQPQEARRLLRARAGKGSKRGQTGQEYIHSYKMLVGYWNPDPGKTSTAVIFITPNGAAARPTDASKREGILPFFQPVKLPVFSDRKGA